MPKSDGMTRRELLKLGLAGGAYALASSSGLELFAAEALAPKAQVWVVKGTDKTKLMEKALEIIQANGGFGHAVNKLALKVNAAWARGPETGANTHPELVKAFLKGCREFGVKDVSVPEYPCSSPREAFPKSGILEAVEGCGFKMQAVTDSYKGFETVSVPQGKAMDKTEAVADFVNADAVVNMPVCKSHGGAGLSIAMKNWMGAVRERRSWHQDNLHQRIADSITIFKPVWTIADATRIMLEGGPQGPSNAMKHANALVISKDQVAVDAYCAQSFWEPKSKSVARASYIKLAAGMGLGVDSLENMEIKTVET